MVTATLIITTISGGMFIEIRVVLIGVISFSCNQTEEIMKVKSLSTLALEAIPPTPSPSTLITMLLPRCHTLFEPVYNLYYEEERAHFRDEHRVLFK